LYLEAQRLQHAPGEPLLLAQQAEQQMLRADVVMPESSGLALREDRDELGATGEASEHAGTGAPLRGFDLEDLELERAARRRDLDRLALLVAHDRLADRRLVRELVLGRVRL